VDTVASVLAIFIIVAVPTAGIVLFWYVHILPEKIAEKRQHPQKDAIKVLCLLSLFFGGMLWPFAWLWAYSKPVLHKLAYGRDKHDDYYIEKDREASLGRDVQQREDLQEELGRLRLMLDAMSRHGELSESLHALRQQVVRLEHSTTNHPPDEVPQWKR
jgi:Protein of unknown function (DUF3302)